ncbi:MAG: DUF418 domain-containing protein [Phycisphaerales bacterium]|nr:DUF418 domain-containing protein [Phycisphaerales bacterium]
MADAGLTLAAPALPAKRIASIDVLRGVALLGILVLNIQTFAMPFEAYTNPTAYGDLTGANHWVAYFTHVLGDMKFMAIFSMLFGAGIVLLTERLEATGRSAIGVHYRRMLWLLAFGFIHAYGIWYGDILVGYAICGMWVVWLRSLQPWLLVLIGLVVVSISSILMGGMGLLLLVSTEEELAEITASLGSPEESIQSQLEIYRSGWVAQLSHRLPAAGTMQTMMFGFYTLWRASGLMLIGMALYRWGVFSCRASTATYAMMLALGILFGIPIVWWGLELKWDANWEWIQSEFLYYQFNYWGSMLVALGWVGLVMLFVKSGMLRWFQHALACVGRMALTNYLLQSLVCTLVFYGHGLGYFGEVDRVGQILVVLGVSVAQLIWSPLWLAAFRFGPFEWLWRSLTYWNLQPLRRRPPVIPGG